MCIKCCHEATHSVLAISFGIFFKEVRAPYYECLTTTQSRLVQGTVSGFLEEDVSSHYFKLAIVAGCLGEFYPNWRKSKEFEQAMQQVRPGFNAGITHPVVLSIEKFSEETYQDDYKWYIHHTTFNPSQYRQDLEEVFPVVEVHWEAINMVSERLHAAQVLTRDEIVLILNQFPSLGSGTRSDPVRC